MSVEVRLPALLEPAVGAVRRLRIEGGTTGEVVEGLLARFPTLAVHLFDERRRLRPHVLCFVDGSLTRLEDPDQPVSAEMEFLASVSGGSGLRRGGWSVWWAGAG